MTLVEKSFGTPVQPDQNLSIAPSKDTHCKTQAMIVAFFVMLAMVCLSASAEEGNNAAPTGWIGPFDEWAGQKDMSAYNPTVKPVPSMTMNETTAWEYHGISVVDSDIPLPPGNGIVIARKFTKKPVRINFAPPVQWFGSLDTTGSGQNVVPEYGYFTWYWIQDTQAPQTIIIRNTGSGNASGEVRFVSIEDGYESSAAFTDLAPGTNRTVTIVFPVIASRSSIGLKPIGFTIVVNPNIVTWSGQLTIDAIEIYNNDASHLPDPDDGDNLETSDLYHFPFDEGYAILQEAATAGDNTSSPYDTAFALNDYVQGVMNYRATDQYLLYAASDLYIKSHENQGVCDEFATMDVTLSRSLGIPSRFLGITWINESGSMFGHGILEHWINGQWIHSDPTWHSFNNPRVYKMDNNTHMNLTKYTDADDNRHSSDLAGDGLLRYEDFVADPLGELTVYN